jgi:hypothetical protein
MLKKWYLHPAEWWEFWYPQSSVQGGGMAGALLFIAIFGIMKFLEH